MNISLNTYSLRNEFDLLGKDKMGAVIKICNDLGITQTELLDSHVNFPTLKEDMKRLEDHGIKTFAFAPHGKLLVKPAELKEELENGKEWLKRAHSLGVKNIRFQVGNGPFPALFPPMEDFDEEEWADYNEGISEAIELSAQVVDPLIEIAEQLDVYIGIETHHSYSSNYLYMTKFNQRFKSSHYGWVFDIGNYENDVMRWKALDVIKKNTLYIHAKAYDFDEKGFEKTLDYPKACKILNDAGFKGTWSIEFEGQMNGILGAMRSNELIKYSIASVQGKHYQMNTTFPSDQQLIEKYKQ
jgi:sugar phosphate isomerase/epimerase